MPSQHKHAPIPFRPPEGDRSWLLEHAKATGQPVNRILAEALAEYRQHCELHPRERIEIIPLEPVVMRRRLKVNDRRALAVDVPDQLVQLHGHQGEMIWATVTGGLLALRERTAP